LGEMPLFCSLSLVVYTPRLVLSLEFSNLWLVFPPLGER
jgi:hypothetical protein